MTASGLPLEGVRVVDLTLARAGPTCVRHLADWGADVIAVSPPDGGRELMSRDGSDFQNLHRNKRFVSLDLKSEAGHAAFLKLVATADVLVENMRAPVKRRLKIAYEDLKPVNPRLVYGSISGFGQDGPYAQRAGVDQIAQGLGGLMSITGEPGRGPMRVGVAVNDVMAGTLLALGVMMALYQRQATGEGRYVHTSLLEAQVFLLDFQAARWLQAQEVPKQAGNNHPTSIPTGVFKTKNGHINIASTGQVMWERLCNAIEAPELVRHPDYSTGALRSKNRDAINAEIDKRTVHKTSAAWIEIFNKTGVPCGPIYTIDQMFADEQVKHIGIAQTAKRPDGKDQTFVGQPVKLSRTPSKIVATPPEQGQHTDEVLKEFGFAENEIAELHKVQAV